VVAMWSQIFRERQREVRRTHLPRTPVNRPSTSAGAQGPSTAHIVLSAFFGWLPALGWGTAILGLAMIAGEFYPVARLMDYRWGRGQRSCCRRGRRGLTIGASHLGE
jgi:hypothetical protein